MNDNLLQMNKQRYAKEPPAVYKMNLPSLDLIEHISTKGLTTYQALC